MADDATNETRPEEYYRQILETAPDAMVVVGSDGRIVYANRQAETLFGYPIAELLSIGLDALIPERFRGAHGRHLTRFFSAPAVRPMGSALELHGLRHDGVEVPIEVSLSPVHTPTGMLVSAAIRDITERRRVEAAAKTAADRLASAVDSIQDAFAIFDASQRLVLCNSVYRRLVGESVSGPLIGESYQALLDGFLEQLAFDTDDVRARFRDERLNDAARPSTTFEVRTRDGRSLRLTSRRTVEGGMVQTAWDLTDDVRRERELREMQVVAEAASAAKSEFLSSMSHELRTPLNAILGFAQLLQRDRKEPLSERHKERVSQILKGGEHLLRLIDDVLDLSRIEAGAVSISTEPVGVGDVLAEVRKTLEPLSARVGVQLTVEEPPTPMPMIAADRTRFAQILINFGSNALKYNRPNGTVVLRAIKTDESTVRVEVVDTGFGIARDKQEKLFQPFQRAGQETGPIEGTGIGLVITRRLADLMRGCVGFHSVEGEGSTFWVEMPVMSALPKPEVVRRSHGDGSSLLGGDTRRVVLYVEDNPANVTFMRDLLGSFDAIELVTAATAEEGITIAKQRAPAVILMDINLPGMSGLDALRVLRASEDTQHIPVIALTAAASTRDRERGEQAGFYRYLAKPIKVDDLEAALESLLAPRDETAVS